jgi:hypothetical protein
MASALVTQANSWQPWPAIVIVVPLEFQVVFT